MLNPVTPFLEHQGFMMLDGGLATALEARGWELDDALWSAKVLVESPDHVRVVHHAFLEHGADCIATASYQATVAGFMARGHAESDAHALIRLSADLACRARDDFWRDSPNREGRLRPLVAASIGPYGAYLADGSEYRGDYGLHDEALWDFHLERWQILARSRVDLMACETIPSFPEARALLRLVTSTRRWTWLSFSCRDGLHLSDGTPMLEVARACDTVEHVVAVGVNCVSPSLVADLIVQIRRGTDKPIVVYPNSGEAYDAARKVWVGSVDPHQWDVGAWRTGGASLIGGCCRVSPQAIRTLRHRLGDRTP